MIYENYSFTSKSEVEKLLNGNNEDIKKAIIGAINGIKEWEWLQNLCLKYIFHNDFWVAKTAIDGIGDIARIHKKLDVNKVKYDFNQISDERLKPIINSVMDDIKVFLK
ncbi:hypothetical protein FNW52_14725 [Flavobacterium sp. ZT3R18]|uniref:hypothetical protein n=1 Tax=Flavobacterium sp. ZT3R18 TaxID=2594429 RepID=UPI00117B5F24|nr:hypothetical protein [Flavobacterium sp. ZT3R18]TRX34061.1 hypothetical protein FNW52_14725 [Flavobacterium sp. ZT3R18]